MPIYDYSCANCGHVVEVIHGVHEPRPTVCPECGGLLRKRISSPAIHFRGTGWAKKDARQAAAGRAEKAGKNGGRDREGGTAEDGAAGGPKADRSGTGRREAKPSGPAASTPSSGTD